ncbi:MAG: hypothetical protein IMW89_12105 [Ktedonobacteraceae bacterium]|nr:hypothetical protein [Ktedonobacteraceae bacterium]
MRDILDDLTGALPESPNVPAGPSPSQKQELNYPQIYYNCIIGKRKDYSGEVSKLKTQAVWQMDEDEHVTGTSGID